MEKKFRLLLLLALLLTAATGAWAEEQVVYTLDGTQTASNTAYATACVVEQGGMTWSVTGNVNQNPWRIGGKSLSGVDRSVWSKSSLDETVTKVTLEFGTANDITVNSITMMVAGDADFNNVIDTKAVTFSANNKVDVTPTEGKEWKNAYYRFVFNVTVEDNSNKFLQLKSIKFYNDPDAQQQGGGTEPTYAVTFAEGTPETDKWKADPAADVKKGQQVTVTYTGAKKVIGVKAEKKAAAPASLITNPVVGQVIGSDGKNYAYGSLPTGVTAVAKICYVSGSNGLALALTDEESKMNWSTAIETCAAHTPAITGGTWKLASKDEWSNMISAAGSHTALRDGFSSVGGTNMKEDYPYWSSTEDGSDKAWYYSFSYGIWIKNNNSVGYVRACLAF